MSQNLRNYHHHSLPIQRILFYSQFPTLFFVSVQGNDKLGLIFEMMNHLLFGKNGSRFQVIKLYIYIYIYIVCVRERHWLMSHVHGWYGKIPYIWEQKRQIKWDAHLCLVVLFLKFRFLCAQIFHISYK